MSEQRNLNPTDVYDQYGLADDYLMGWDIEIEQDYQKAAYWYEKAAEQGYSLAQESIGDCYRDGTGVEKDNEKAAYWYEKAASNPEEPNVDAQYKLGTLYDLGLGVKRDSKKAAYWYEKAASALRFPNADAQYNLGLMYASGEGVEKDRTKAVYWFEKAASNPRNPNANAQLNLGLFYESGVGVEEDLNKAVYWLEKAVAQGAEGAEEALSRVREKLRGTEEDRPAYSGEQKENGRQTGSDDLEYAIPERQYYEGKKYADGDNVKKDMAKAVYWYTRAAERDYYPAQIALAECYEKGEGTKKNYAQALVWYKKAEHASFSAKFKVGTFYLYGLDVEEDHETAAQWFEKATSEEKYASRDARYMLGLMCECGDGVRQDLYKAIELYRHIPKTAKARIPKVEERLARQSVMNVEEYARAEREARTAWDEARASYGAECGYKKEQYALGMICKRKSDYDEAYSWFEAAADQGYAPAQYELGCCYENGSGVKRDQNKAAYWFEKAAAQGAEGADKALSRVREDIRKAEEYRLRKEQEERERKRARAEKEEKERLARAKALEEKEMRQAAREKRLGNRDANPTDPVEQFKLAQFYADLDIDEDEDSALAAKWYERAAQAGYAPAQRQFAWCCENACGVARNYKEAARWYDEAARQGDRTAKEALGAVLEKLGSGYDGNKYEREREKKIGEARRHAKKATLGAVLFVVAAAAAGYLRHMGSVDIGIDDRTFTFLGVFAVFALSLAIGIFRTFREGFLVCMVIAAIPVLFIAYTSALPIVPLAFALFCLAAAVLIVAVNKTRKFNAPVNRDKLIREYRKTHNN